MRDSSVVARLGARIPHTMMALPPRKPLAGIPCVKPNQPRDKPVAIHVDYPGLPCMSCPPPPPRLCIFLCIPM